MSEDTRTYEVGYLLIPTVPEAEIDAHVVSIKEAIEKVEGSVLSEAAPDFIDLAYRIEKNVASKKLKWNQAYFGWIKFTAAPESLEQLKKLLDANLSVIRYITIKTSADNNVTFKKPKIDAKREDAFAGELLEDEELEGEEEVEGFDKPEAHEALPNLESEVVADIAAEAPVEVEAEVSEEAVA